MRNPVYFVAILGRNKDIICFNHKVFIVSFFTLQLVGVLLYLQDIFLVLTSLICFIYFISVALGKYNLFYKIHFSYFSYR